MHLGTVAVHVACWVYFLPLPLFLPFLAFPLLAPLGELLGFPRAPWNCLLTNAKYLSASFLLGRQGWRLRRRLRPWQAVPFVCHPELTDRFILVVGLPQRHRPIWKGDLSLSHRHG